MTTLTVIRILFLAARLLKTPWSPCCLQLTQQEVPGKFVGSVQQLLEQGLKLLQEMAGKAQFYRERLAQVPGVVGLSFSCVWIWDSGRKRIANQ